MSATKTLTTQSATNANTYTTVLDDKFGQDTSLNWNLWPVAWGYGDDFSFGNGCLTLTSYAREGWANVGFMQADNSRTAGQGYGLYSVTASADANQGVGICICLWPSDNNWPGAELDMLESWDPSRQTGYATIHWRGADGSNQYEPHQLNLDLTQIHTYALDWERGSLTYYVDGQQIFQQTDHVPLDAADGGVNESFGAEVTAAGSAPVSDHVSLHIYEMKIQTTDGNGGGGGGNAGTITLSAPGTVREAAPGAGADVTETVHATGLSAIYEVVMTSGNVAESGWTRVALDASGNASFSVHMAHSGDYVLAVNDPNNVSVRATSSQVTITDTNPPPPPSITLSAPGTVREAAPGAGVSVLESVHATGLSAIYEVVMTSGNVAESGWTRVALDASGNASFSVHMAHGGDYVLAVNDPNNATVQGWSSQVVITDGPVPTVTVKDAGHSANLPLIGSGSQSFAPSDTGLPVTVAESVSGGTTSFTTPAGGDTTAIVLKDVVGGSYTTHGFETVSAQLAGANDGMLTVAGITRATVHLGAGDYTVNVWQSTKATPNPNGATFIAGSGHDVIAFHGTETASFTGGSGTASYHGGGGADTITFGHGADDVWGGGGADVFVYGAHAGAEKIEDFSKSADMLQISSTLQSSMTEEAVSGGTMLSFGSGQSLMLAGVTNFDTHSIHWT